jgi:hypothetical protein
MPTGFIYIVTTVGANYQQRTKTAVPTWHGDRIYFGPCKIPMRPRIAVGDYVFGISPADPKPRRIVFAAKIEDRLTFAEAYERFRELRGPSGPIHVRPTSRPKLVFPESHYEHIPGANHADSWRSDLGTPELDIFLVCSPAKACEGAWLGEAGPLLDDELVAFLQSCQVHGAAGLLSERNSTATPSVPVRHGGLYRGLHLETSDPLELTRLVCARVNPVATTTREAENDAIEKCRSPRSRPRNC